MVALFLISSCIFSTLNDLELEDSFKSPFSSSETLNQEDLVC
jgi:hypothetical protein